MAQAIIKMIHYQDNTISIIIPALNEAEILATTLMGLPAASDLEVILVDGGSTDGTWELAGRFPHLHRLQAPRGRGCQMNAGARAARGRLLAFLHADTLMGPAHLAALRRAAADPSFTAGAFELSLTPPVPALRFIARAANWRSRFLGLPYGDQVLILRPDLFRTLGGFSHRRPEDLDLVHPPHGAHPAAPVEPAGGQLRPPLAGAGLFRHHPAPLAGPGPPPGRTHLHPPLAGAGRFRQSLWGRGLRAEGPYPHPQAPTPNPLCKGRPNGSPLLMGVGRGVWGEGRGRRPLALSPHLIPRQTPAAGRAGGGGAAVAVVSQVDGPGCQAGEVELPDGLGQARGQGQVKGLVEVAIEEPPFPGDADEAAAHEAGDGGRVEAGRQFGHVALVIAGFFQVFLEAADGHVEQGVQLVEVDIVEPFQLPLEAVFQGALLRWQISPAGIIHQVQFQARTPDPVTHAVQEA